MSSACSVFRRRLGRAVSYALVAVVGVSVGGCSSDDTFLPALLADPMASYQAEGISLVRSDNQARGTSLVTGKPVYAKVVRRYELEDEDEGEEVLGRAIVAAEAAGWVFDDGPPRESVFDARVTGASKSFDWGSARLILTVGPGTTEGDILLSVTLSE